ncbi:ubiquinol-cytochrome c reductase iron-sulfur subunit [Halosimplex aquaticum]|uniref:Ubiquinol-cytochrome c reductase iron-sulfur subunit n=1 Tax=Halosimplex aquaticum TaxID=3026162 RepID=A0ABD5Y0U9_9EURY|nr:ubiquinol-cytochrome c reductase iron-sulfur subunit [Halosimplex aquaticum]
MPLDEDKYPGETGRRRFVKGVVGSSALASLGVGGAAAINLTTAPSGGGGGPTQFVAIENIDGPAPRGMPIIPMEVTDAGELRGVFPEPETEVVAGVERTVAETEIGGVTYSPRWFQYCGVEQYQGVQPTADADNFFRAASSPPPAYEWQQDIDEGTVLTVDMFDDYKEWGNGIGVDGLGKPAWGRWRSEGEDAKTIPIQVLRSPEISTLVEGGEGFYDYSNVPEQARSFVEAATEQDFIAWLNKCTHFCCVPGYKVLTGSANFDASNEVYCQCHQSVYNPFSPVLKQFVARPRPTE